MLIVDELLGGWARSAGRFPVDGCVGSADGITVDGWSGSVDWTPGDGDTDDGADGFGGCWLAELPSVSSLVPC